VIRPCRAVKVCSRKLRSVHVACSVVATKLTVQYMRVVIDKTWIPTLTVTELVKLHETCINMFYGQTNTKHTNKPHLSTYSVTNTHSRLPTNFLFAHDWSQCSAHRHKLSYYLATLQLSTSVKPNSEQHFKIKMTVSWYVAYCDTDRRFRGAPPVKVCQSTRCS
jgi:hypothetical protein